ncbi:MAG: CoA-transferase [Firmicutes bacterium]|nr:CoA-transferase [Bacillota bacterium]
MSKTCEQKVIATKMYDGTTFPVYYRQVLPLDAPRVRYTGFKPEKIMLKAGSVRREGALPLPCDIMLERDAAIPLRDGTIIYADIFRPVGAGKYPVIMTWSPYGKEYGGQWLDDIPGRVGIPLAATSQLERFEGPDPAYWVNQGYAIVNPDNRGAYSSAGNIHYWGTQDSEDGYDVIEWVAAQVWSNGNVGMSGNSWLTVSQWFIAAAQPPHLTAIAPWEGFSDHFRDSGNRGGIPCPEFPEMIFATFASNGLVENQPRMIVEYQLMNTYWEDKRAKLEQITIPAYVVASYTNPAHTHGTFAGYRQISSPKKWLRVHNSNEWPDYYQKENVADLTKFFDRYLKGEDNDWEATPRVRLSVLDPGGKDTVNRVESEFPLARTIYKKLYLQAGTHTLSLTPAAKIETNEYDVNAVQNKKTYLVTFDKDTELTGYMKLHLWVQAQGADDMELAVTVEKLDVEKQPLVDPHTGLAVAATGQLRVSHRELDEEKSTEAEPYLKAVRELKLNAGEIVPVEIGIWPMGMIYHKGESLRLTVGAYKPSDERIPFGKAKIEVPTTCFTFDPKAKPPIQTLGGQAEQVANIADLVQSPPTRNKGKHIFYTGGIYDSYLLVPEVPKK